MHQLPCYLSKYLTWNGNAYPFRGFCKTCSNQLLECPMCRATIEEVASDNTWHYTIVSAFLNTLPLSFLYYMILRNCREVIIIATHRVHHILNMIIIFYTFLFLQYSILNQEKDYNSITERKITFKCITPLRYIILNVAFIYIDITYKLSYCKFKLQKNIILYLPAVQITFSRFYLNTHLTSD